MLEIEALRIGEKINVHGRARAEALYDGAKEEDTWYVVVTIGPDLEWNDDKIREVAERLAPSAAMIHIAEEESQMVITSVPKDSSVLLRRRPE